MTYEELYQSALLADAAYIDLSSYYRNGELDEGLDDLRDEFAERGFTEAQTGEFLERYDVLHHQPNTISGFSATIFIDTYNDSKITVAFRGTEANEIPSQAFLQDLVQDLKLALGRTELDGDSQHQYTESLFFEAGLIDANGNPASGVNQSVDFVGHSLGGYLALMAGYDYPQLVGEISTFNGAGLTGLDYFYNEYVLPFVSDRTLDASRVHNFYAESGGEITAGQDGEDFLSTFGRPGSRTSLFIENQGSASIGNHSMIHLVNALSVGRLLEKLDSSLSIAEIDDMLWQSSNKNRELTNTDGTPAVEDGAESLDTLVRHLATVLGGDFLELTTTNDAHALYELLDSLPVSFSVQTTAQVQRVIRLHSAGDIAGGAEDTAASRAAMYALLTGVPFALIPDADFEGGIYADTPANAPFDITQYSPGYLQDRLDHYRLVMQRNKQDIALDQAVNEQAVDTLYTDFASSDLSLRTHGQITGDTRHVYFGTQGSDGPVDNFVGSQNDDRLYSLGGNDQLNGSGGNDYLEGGAGADTYRFAYGDGRDTIVDTDTATKNFLRLQHTPDGTLTSIGTLQRLAPGANTFGEVNAEGAYINTGTLYELVEQADGSTGLVITVDGGSGGMITITDFGAPESNHFGLSFQDAPAPELAPLSDNAITIGTGTDWARDQGGDQSLVYVASDYSGNLDPTDSEYPRYFNGVDDSQGMAAFSFSGGSANDQLIGMDHGDTNPNHLSDGFFDYINGFAGDDLIRGDGPDSTRGDRDRLRGGEGNDQVYGEGANDIVAGGMGSDYLDGGQGENTLFGADLTLTEYSDDQLQEILDGSHPVENADDRDTLIGGADLDRLAAGSGDDILSGMNGHNAYFGFRGGDTILGGDGYDAVWSDAFARAIEWGGQNGGRPSYVRMLHILHRRRPSEIMARKNSRRLDKCGRL